MITTTSKQSNIIAVSKVKFTWPSNTHATIDIDEFTLKKGEHLFIKGPSGCGKSTLLSLLTGINIADQGQISILGQSLAQLSASQRDRFRADHIGYIFQQFNLLPYLSVLENVCLPCHFSPLRKQQALVDVTHDDVHYAKMANSQTHNKSDLIPINKQLTTRAYQLLERLHLPSTLFERPIVELSIGQQQRVAAARALIGRPALIIADEPTSALDFDNRISFIELLMELADQANSSLVFVSHDSSLEKRFSRSINLPKLNKIKHL